MSCHNLVFAVFSRVKGVLWLAFNIHLNFNGRGGRAKILLSHTDDMCRIWWRRDNANSDDKVAVVSQHSMLMDLWLGTFL